MVNVEPLRRAVRAALAQLGLLLSLVWTLPAVAGVDRTRVVIRQPHSLPRVHEAAAESWFSQAHLEDVLWAACAATLVLAFVWMLRRLLKATALNWGYAGIASTAMATAFFVACGSNHDEPLSPTQRRRAESVEITGVPAGTEFYLPDAH